MNRVLLKLKHDGELNPALYTELYCSSGRIPCIYGLPKIHKPAVPLRPIVSFVTSPTYALSKYLVKVLSPLVGNSPSFVRNSKEFVQFISEQTLAPGEVLASFDVVSLFMRVPVELAIRMARQRLESDPSLNDRTSLSVQSIITLLELCLNATYFSFRGDVYQQIYGTAMGSPVSVVVANLVMEHVEERALSSFAVPPRFWKRYVDDICVAMRGDLIPPFLDHLNSIESTIQFTVEEETEGSTLPFLDVCLSHHSDGTIGTSVYRKPTHTDRYLDYGSHHPLQRKAGVIRTLFTRAKCLSSTAVEHSTEVNHLVAALRKNGYPKKMIDKSVMVHQPRQRCEDEGKKVVVTLPYIRGTSETLRRILARANIEVVFRPHSTLRQQLVHPKDPVCHFQRPNVVYSVPCQDCEATYVGQTGRQLATRMDEHRRAVTSCDTATSAIAEHAWSADHRIDWDAAEVLETEVNLHRRLVLESWHIHKQKCPLNRERGALPSDYTPLLA